jgi:hypothetical protein
MKSCHGVEVMRVWITVYALAPNRKLRIVEAQARRIGANLPDAIVITSSPRCREEILKDWTFSGEGIDWHRSYQKARNRAEQMRFERIAKLRKQIERLEALEF